MEIKEFDDLINLGQIKRTVVLSGRKIDMHTLSSGEYAQMSHHVKSDPGTTQEQKFESLQRWTLAYSMDAIDSKPMSLDDKEKLLSLGQLALSNLLYTEYLGMVDEQDKLIQDAKKNSSQPNLN